VIVSEQLNRKKLPTLRLRVGDQSLLLFDLGVSFHSRRFPVSFSAISTLINEAIWEKTHIYFEES